MTFSNIPTGRSRAIVAVYYFRNARLQRGCPSINIHTYWLHIILAPNHQYTVGSRVKLLVHRVRNTTYTHFMINVHTSTAYEYIDVINCNYNLRKTLIAYFG